jgi:hypothetical protein
MALTDKQRVAFFKLARRAYNNQQPSTDFDCWRKHEMTEAGLKDSIKKVSKVIGFDILMRHFAELAYDMELVNHYQSNEIRMLDRIISGLIEDMKYIVNCLSEGREQYTFRLQNPGDDVNKIRSVMQKLGNEVSALCQKHNIKTFKLPTAAAPYFLRGKRAAELADLISLKTGPEKRRDARLEIK